VWRVLLIVGLGLLQGERYGPAIFLLVWGLVPYLALAGLAVRIGSRAVVSGRTAIVEAGGTAIIGIRAADHVAIAIGDRNGRSPAEHG
jgi:hypothetical protein